MESVPRTLMLWAHIAAGVVSLITMVIAYTTKNPPTAHAKVGRDLVPPICLFRVLVLGSQQ